MLYRCVLIADWLTPGIGGGVVGAFIREGGGCGWKFFSDRRGQGGREEA
jgi:hypothetical protein